MGSKSVPVPKTNGSNLRPKPKSQQNIINLNHKNIIIAPMPNRLGQVDPTFLEGKRNNLPIAKVELVNFDGPLLVATLVAPAPKTEIDHRNHYFFGSLFLNLLSLAAVVYVLGFSVQAREHVGWVFIWIVIVCLFLILWYVGHALYNASDLDYLANILRDTGEQGSHDVLEYFDELAKEKPEMVMTIKCYHWENVRGDRREVLTHVQTRQIQFGSWYDQSDRPLGLSDFSVVKLSVEKVPIMFADQETQDSVNAQRQAFQNEHQNCDEFCDFSEEYRLVTHKGHVMFVHGNRRGWLQTRFYLWSIYLCVNWPFRVWMECTAVRATVKMSKVISCGQAFNPTSVAELSINGRIFARGSNDQLKSKHFWRTFCALFVFGLIYLFVGIYRDPLCYQFICAK